VRGKKLIILFLLGAALILGGCSMRTVDEMYCVPKRSEAYHDLQSVIDGAMQGLEYYAPLTGARQQPVQMADLDGDSEPEYLLFAKSGDEHPLRILIFRKQEDTYIHADTIESNGYAFDQVEFVQMDDRGGMEIVVGRLLNDQVMRSLSVYKFIGGNVHLLLTVNYSKFLTLDMNSDSIAELFVLRPGQTDTDNGIATVYRMVNGNMERSNEATMSQPADKLKRIITGKLHGGQAAVFAASAVGDNAIVTDVYTQRNGFLANVTYAPEPGSGVQTLRNYYVYADDIDNDEEVELPDLIVMLPLEDQRNEDKHELIRWYAITPEGNETSKMYTYHNYVGGWYLQLDPAWAARVTVVKSANQYRFYLWDEHFGEAKQLMTISQHTGQDRETQGRSDGRFILHKAETVVYAAKLEAASESLGITQDSVIRGFNMITMDWKTGET